MAPGGNWATDIGSLLLVTPVLVMTWYITETTVPEAQAIEVTNYLFAHQTPQDGGWSTRIDGNTTLMGTVFAYVALRLLGLPAHDERLCRAKETLRRMGGALCTPSWCKFWLCLLGLYEWEGVDPFPAEFWYLRAFYASALCHLVANDTIFCRGRAPWNVDGPRR
jgi:lanosterol synthase